MQSFKMLQLAYVDKRLGPLISAMDEMVRASCEALSILPWVHEYTYYGCTFVLTIVGTRDLRGADHLRAAHGGRLDHVRGAAQLVRHLALTLTTDPHPYPNPNPHPI